MSNSTGQVVSEDFDYDGGRRVTAYVPKTDVDTIVFAGDGQLITAWGQTLHGAGMNSTMIVGTHRLEDETLRLQEYSSGENSAAFTFDPVRFAAHEQFFVDDVREWVRTRFGLVLGADRTAVSACQLVRSLRSRWVSDIPICTASCSPPHPALAIDHPK
jgi:hypothetical protein